MYWALFILGVTGSLHCIGMCSPLMMAVTANRPNAARLIYNAGRILTYAILGAIVAQVGQISFLKTYQGVSSIVLGILIWILAARLVPQPTWINKPTIKLTSFIKATFSQFLKQGTWLSIFSLGMLNGLIPCGVSSIAIISCLIMPDATAGFTGMLVFGFGTWPIMLLYPILAKKIAGFLRINFQKLTVMSMLISGALLVGHGLLNSSHKVPGPSPSQSGIVICP